MSEAAQTLGEFHKQLRIKAEQKHVPIAGEMELTARCNLSCRMCYIRRPAGDIDTRRAELSAKDWISLARQIADAGTLLLGVTGGEPLLHPEFQVIFRELTKLGFRITLLSNATLIDGEMARWLGQHPPATLDITLYGSTEEVYERTTGRKDAYRKARQGIENALEQGINARLKATICHSNMHDYAGIRRIAEEYGLELLTSTLLHKAFDGTESAVEEERLSAAEMLEFELNTEECVGKLQGAIFPEEEMIARFRDMQPMFCAAGRSSYWIDWKGKIKPCALFAEPAFNTLEEGFSKAWDRLVDAVQAINAPGECLHCEHRPYCPVCPGRLQRETGTTTGHCDYICSLAKMKHDKSSLYKERCI